MSVKNYYTEFPEMAYKKTSVEMGEIILYLKNLSVSREIKIAAYVIFRNESGNGFRGVNNNYCGIQADSGRWADYLNKHVAGTVIVNENMTGGARRFLAFDSFKASIDFLVDRITARQLYVGGTCNVIAKMKINDAQDWVTAYWQSWVTGKADAIVPKNEQYGLLSTYYMGEKIF